MTSTIVPIEEFVKDFVERFGVSWRPYMDALKKDTQVDLPNEMYDCEAMQVLKKLRVKLDNYDDDGYAFWYSYIFVSGESKIVFHVTLQYAQDEADMRRKMFRRF